MTFDFKMWGSQAASVKDKNSVSKVQIQLLCIVSWSYSDVLAGMSSEGVVRAGPIQKFI